MNKDLEEMIDEAVEKESQLQVMGESLALQNKQFAEYLEAKRIADKELEVLWDIVKEEMIKEGLTEHENDYIKLKLSPSGKYKAEDIDQIDDALCDIKKVLNNISKKTKLNMIIGPLLNIRVLLSSHQVIQS